MEVHRQLGFGFAEILYKGRKLNHKYFADFVMFDKVIVEAKAFRDGIADEHVSQTLNYLKASGCSVGLIINFSKKSLEHKHLVL